MQQNSNACSLGNDKTNETGSSTHQTVKTSGCRYSSDARTFVFNENDSIRIELEPLYRNDITILLICRLLTVADKSKCTAVMIR
mmetsp:Transcript_17623/g.26898  ORF Transcript_17623/g.26898 Transcript_17623/m.26898 type:complete len:84 (+) Transcript_17623:392-643(+)